MRRRVLAVTTLFLLCCYSVVWGSGRERDSTLTMEQAMLRRIFEYGEQASGRRSQGSPPQNNAYTRYNIEAQRRNFTLTFVPSMYAITHGRREYAGETFMTFDVDSTGTINAKRHLNVGTVPKHATTMEPMLQYLTPTVYDETIVNGTLLSPFHHRNRHYYRYIMTPLTEGRMEIVFRPRVYNTQLVGGTAIADRATGRLLNIGYDGEYDMIRFKTRLVMNDISGPLSLFPRQVSIDARFRFLGNKVTASFNTIYGIDKTFPDTIIDSHDRTTMDTIRPYPLPQTEAEIYARYDSLKRVSDSLQTDIDADSRWKKILWDVIGDHLLNRIHGNFGKDGKGYLKLTPILNPLYMTYSSKRGFVYKFRVRLRWDFSKNSNIALFFKGGYSFKLNEFYYRAPLRYTFNSKHNGYIEIEYANGNRMTTSDVVDRIRATKPDSINWGALGLDYFNHMYEKLRVNYDLSDRWTIQPGMVYHRYTAVDKEGFRLAGKATEYNTYAPTMEVQYRPFGWRGAAYTLNYERGLKGVGNSGVDYERIEMDASWFHSITAVRSLSLRFGIGFYTDRNKEDCFLFYENFREDNLSDGWNDDWSGNFQILNRHWYNSSTYYVRANATYESPMMVLSHVPWIGRIVEIERIYVSTMAVEHLHPYTEFGYGFTNRVFSTGIFWSTKNGKFDGIGARIGLELFRDW